MSLDPFLLDLLACPIDKQPLLYLAGDGLLYNPRLRRGYQVLDGIPVLLADQGKTVTDERHADLLRRAAAAETPGDVVATMGVPLPDLLRDHVGGPREGRGGPARAQDAASA